MADPIAVMTSELDQASAHLAAVVSAMPANKRAAYDHLLGTDPVACCLVLSQDRRQAEFVMALAKFGWALGCHAAFTKGAER